MSWSVGLGHFAGCHEDPGVNSYKLLSGCSLTVGAAETLALNMGSGLCFYPKVFCFLTDYRTTSDNSNSGSCKGAVLVIGDRTGQGSRLRRQGGSGDSKVLGRLESASARMTHTGGTFPATEVTVVDRGPAFLRGTQGLFLQPDFWPFRGPHVNPDTCAGGQRLLASWVELGRPECVCSSGNASCGPNAGLHRPVCGPYRRSRPDPGPAISCCVMMQMLVPLCRLPCH